MNEYAMHIPDKNGFSPPSFFKSSCIRPVSTVEQVLDYHVEKEYNERKNG
jgi:hypothetical protein